METLNSNHLMGKFEKFNSNHLKFERFFIVLDMCSNRLVPTTFGLFESSLKHFRTDGENGYLSMVLYVSLPHHFDYN